MIWATLLPIRKFLANLPAEFWYVVSGLLLLAATAWAFDGRGYDRRDAEQAEIERKALEVAREGDAVAHDAIDQATDKVEQENEEAKAAADGSDDPLRDAFDILRTR